MSLIRESTVGDIIKSVEEERKFFKINEEGPAWTMSLTLGDLVPGFFHSLQRQRPVQRPLGRTSCRNFYLSECLMAKSILNFHFDYWNSSLNWNIFWSGCKHLSEKKQQERRYHLHAYGNIAILHTSLLFWNVSAYLRGVLQRTGVSEKVTIFLLIPPKIKDVMFRRNGPIICWGRTNRLGEFNNNFFKKNSSEKTSQNYP